MLNVRSGSAPEPKSGPRPAGSVAENDRTARARIRDAAIECFATNGVAATSVRAIAAAAGVSPGLVIHHFGSKDGLRVACDEHVARLINEYKAAGAAQGVALDVMASIRRYTSPPLLRYLARTLVDGSPHVSALVDALVADGVARTHDAARLGMLRPYEDEPARVAVLSVWSLGALVLHEHLERLIGEDITGDLTRAPRYMAAVIDMLGRPVFTEAMYTALRDGLTTIPAGAHDAPDNAKEG
jgi:AcrR family transcriptional regulator